MRFRNVNGALIAADEDSSDYVFSRLDVDFVDMVAEDDLRTIEQNNKMWPMLRDFSKQIELAGEMRTETEWKYILSQPFEATRIIPGINGEMVFIPAQTSKFGKRKFRDFIEFIYAEGSNMGVKWSD